MTIAIAPIRSPAGLGLVRASDRALDLVAIACSPPFFSHLFFSSFIRGCIAAVQIGAIQGAQDEPRMVRVLSGRTNQNPSELVGTVGPAYAHKCVICERPAPSATLASI